ncbi:hypothetical protein BGZ99_002329, partial [Dissophora globulifera]
RYLTLELRDEVEQQTDRTICELNVMLEKAAVTGVSVLLDESGGDGSGGVEGNVLRGENRVTHRLDTIDWYPLLKLRIH